MIHRNFLFASFTDRSCSAKKGAENDLANQTQVNLKCDPELPLPIFCNLLNWKIAAYLETFIAFVGKNHSHKIQDLAFPVSKRNELVYFIKKKFCNDSKVSWDGSDIVTFHWIWEILNHMFLVHVFLHYYLHLEIRPNKVR